jgi:hypothetical protein
MHLISLVLRLVEYNCSIAFCTSLAEGLDENIDQLQQIRRLLQKHLSLSIEQRSRPPQLLGN